MNHSTVTKARLYISIMVIPLLIFGYIFTLQNFLNNFFEYTLYNIISIATVFFFLFFLKGGVRSLFPAWLFFWIFILAYFLKFYWVILDDSLLTNRAHFYIGIINDQKLMIRVFSLITFSFLSFVVSCFFIKMIYVSKFVSAEENYFPVADVSALSTYITFFLIISLFALTTMFSENLKMGKGVELAGNLTGAIVYIRILVLPILMVFFIWQGYQRNNKNIVFIGFFNLLLYGVVDGALRESKSSVLLSVIIIVFFFILSKINIKKNVRIVMICFFLLSIFTYPALKEYRERVRYEDISFSTAALDFYTFHSGFEIVSEPVSMVLSRVIGVGSLSVVINNSYDPLYFDGLVKIFSVEMHNYVNEKIFGAIGAAPSILGYLYILFGFFGVLIFIPFFVYAIFSLWFFIGSNDIKYKVVLQAGFLKLLLGELSDGDLGRGLVFRMPVFICTMLLCELLLRIRIKRIL